MTPVAVLSDVLNMFHTIMPANRYTTKLGMPFFKNLRRPASRSRGRTSASTSTRRCPSAEFLYLIRISDLIRLEGTPDGSRDYGAA